MLLKTSLVFRSGSNSLMFANYSVFGDAREVRSFVLCQKEMFGYDWISALKISKHFGHFFYKKFSWTVQILVMFMRFEVQFWAQMRCLNVFDVWSSKVRDVQSSVFIVWSTSNCVIILSINYKPIKLSTYHVFTL